MIHSRINATTLRDRLDASYYTPEVLANEARLLARGAAPLRSLIDTKASNYGVLPPSEDYLPLGAGVPLIRGGDLDGGAIRDPEVAAPLSFRRPRGTAHAGEVLLLIKGACIDSPAGVALVSERHAGSVFNGSCYRLKVGSNCDAGFLVAYCQTSYLLLQKKREIANTGIAYNAEDSILSYWVPSFSLDAQRYIGDKVRQAERLREQARRLRVFVNRRLDAIVPQYDGAVRACSRVESAALEVRLDCRPYRSHFRALEAAIRKVKHDRLADLATLASGDSVPSEEFTQVGVPLVRNRDIGLEGFWAIETAVSDEYARALGRYSASAGLVMVAMDGEFRAQFALELELPLHVNQRVAMVASTRIRPELLTTWLSRPEGQHQLNRWAVKTTVEHTSLDHIGNVLVPRLDEDEETALADSLLLARRGDWYARSLTFAAQTIVEQLIEGQVTESDLVAAQMRLEVGDRGPDQAILQSLRRDGNPAQALIPDLDGLYALLDEEANV